MTASLRALLAGAIDYAGLFPPAALPLDKAFPNYLDYRQTSDAWMLGRFVIPAALLGELLCGYEEEIERESVPVPLALLGRNGSWLSGDNLIRGLSADLDLLREIHHELGNSVTAGTYEMRLTDELVRDTPEIPARVRLLGVCKTLRAAEVPGVTLFFERPPGTLRDMYEFLEHVAAVGAGFKLRCDSREPSLLPSVETIALALSRCRELGIPLKLTAGLHHPLAMVDPEQGVTMHGFINVFVAAAIAMCWAPPGEILVEVLSETEPDFFTFTDQELCWKEWRVDVETVRRMREKLLISFGSCSFDEPRDGLRALGWL
jgi:hypothetical protein